MTVTSIGDVICEYGYLPMKDRVRLAYNLWRPRAPARYPTLVNYSAYAESGTPFDQVKRFLDAGYAYVGANVRGTGSSEGMFSYLQPLQALDGADLIEWAAEQAWSSGSVGMIGPSYGAHMQIAVAALQPPHLKAIVPISVDGCDYRDEAVPGGLFNGALMAAWAFNLQAQFADAGVAARIAGGDTECAAIRAIQPANRSFDEVRQHPLYDDWWQARSLDRVAVRVKVPTLIIHAWQDEWIQPNGAVRVFRLLGSTHKRMVLQNGPHRQSTYLINQDEQLRWLNRWLKGELNGIDSELPVKVHWEVTHLEAGGDATPAWTTTYPSWPIPNLQWRDFRLTATGGLISGTVECKDSCGPRHYVYPFEAISYLTAPVDGDLSILGAPKIAFFLSCDSADTAFMFTLRDVDPAGNRLTIQRSLLRASLREIDQGASSDGEILQSFKQHEPLLPGEVYSIKLSLTAIGHVVRNGHRLELTIAAPCAGPDPVWGFAPALPTTVNTIHHTEAYASTLQLPIAVGERALKPAPRLGALMNQPYARPSEAGPVPSGGTELRAT